MWENAASNLVKKTEEAVASLGVNGVNLDLFILPIAKIGFFFGSCKKMGNYFVEKYEMMIDGGILRVFVFVILIIGGIVRFSI